MSEVLAILLGLAVGLSLGTLGGGGSTLAVPILVFVAGMSAQGATTASLLVVGVASAIGAVGHHRNGNVRLGAGLAFGAAGVGGSRVGTWLNRALPDDALLLAFAVLIVVVAIKMFASAASASADQHREGADGVEGPADLPGIATRKRAGIDLSVTGLAKLGVAASGIGLLTGLFGVGGGFVIVPALTLLLGFGTREAIGTSLLVISINAGIALALRAGSLELDWALVLPFLATVTAGVLAGSRLAARLDAERLTRAFAVMLVLVGVYTAASTLI